MGRVLLTVCDHTAQWKSGSCFPQWSEAYYTLFLLNN